jgi:hypothetical protein
MSYYLYRVFYRVVLKATSFQCRYSPLGGVFRNEEARLLRRSRGNDHVVNASVENLILNFGQTKFVVCHGNCRNGEQTKFFRKRNVHTIRRCEMYCSATILRLRRDIGLDVGEYIR